jgi:hypothetical protein
MSQSKGIIECECGKNYSYKNNYEINRHNSTSYHQDFLRTGFTKSMKLVIQNENERDYRHKYYINNIEEQKQYSKNYYENHKEKMNEINKENQRKRILNKRNENSL